MSSQQVAGVDLDGGGTGLGGGLGALLAAEGEGGAAELDLVAVAERDALVKTEAVVIGAVGAAEVGEEPAAAGRGLDHGVAAGKAGLVEGERVGGDATDGAGGLLEPVHSAVGELQPGLGKGVRHGRKSGWILLRRPG
jgi:hypothetical protein